MAYTANVPNDANGVPTTHRVETIAADGAVTATYSAVWHVTKAGVCAMTLAAPTRDGIEISVISETAAAHTLTITGAGGGTGADVGTFGGAISDNIVLVSRNSKWWTKSTRNVTLA